MAQYVYTMQGVTKIVPPQRTILENIHLSFFPGAKIGVLGLNGSGKSSLLKIMAGQDTDIEGAPSITSTMRLLGTGTYGSRQSMSLGFTRHLFSRRSRSASTASKLIESSRSLASLVEPVKSFRGSGHAVASALGPGSTRSHPLLLFFAVRCFSCHVWNAIPCSHPRGGMYAPVHLWVWRS